VSAGNDDSSSGEKYEGIGCMLICLAIALLIAAGPIVAIIEAVKK
jgi:hypothetical protein